MANGSGDRGRSRTRRAACLLTMIGLLAGAPALASEVVDLRIGAHPDFTRVVFELDRPTGYRIERGSAEGGGQELVVSLDATSIPRKVHSQKSLIGLVRITPEGGGSVARIELAQDGLNLKEMILASPPRIVLDVLRPAGQQAANQAKPPSKPPSAGKPPSPGKPQPKQVARAETIEQPEPVARPAKAPAAAKPPKPAPAVPSPSPQQPKAVAAVSPPAPAAAKPRTTRGAGSAPVARAAVSPGEQAPGAEPSEGGLPTMGMNMQGDPDRERAGRPVPAAERIAAGKPPVTTGRAAASTDAGMGAGSVAAIVGLVVLAGAGVVYMRRRGEGALDDEDEEAVDEGAPITGAADDNPFSGLAAGSSSQPGPSTPDYAGETLEAAIANPPEVEIGGVGMEDDDEEKPAAPLVDGLLVGDGGVTPSEADTLVEGVGAPAIGTAVAGLGGEIEGDEKVMRMVGEMERRMASLESRLDEVNDARERLERQVAAQTEELRVQRAAIARTQRAVRNMNRPEDDGPTEPAIREPQ